MNDAVLRDAFDSMVQVELVAAIRRSELYVPELALVATVGGEVRGHVMVSRAELVGDDGIRRPAATLTPLAVSPQHQRRGLGSVLVQEVLRRADSLLEPMVVLEGSPLYYARFGFEPAAAFGVSIDLPDWAPPEAAQVKPLSAYRSDVRGRLDFPPLAEVGAHGG